MKKMTAKLAREMSSPAYKYPLISFEEIEGMIRRSARRGERSVSLVRKNITVQTYKKLKRRGFVVTDHRAAENIQAGNGLNLKGYWSISW